MSAGFAGRYDSDYLKWQGGMFGKPLYTFLTDRDNPFEFADTDGLIVRPVDEFIYDKKSAPWILSSIAPKWFAKSSTPKSAAMHDSMCRHHGIFVAVWGGWSFIFVTRKQADQWFRIMMRYEDVGAIGSTLNWTGVRIGATWGSWGDDKMKDPVYQKNYKAFKANPPY